MGLGQQLQLGKQQGVVTRITQYRHYLEWLWITPSCVCLICSDDFVSIARDGVGAMGCEIRLLSIDPCHNSNMRPPLVRVRLS